MSSRKLSIDEKKEFIKRFIEVCGSHEPVEVSRLLNISYQAARNYLNGRLPEAYVLLSIAAETPYSIHWLLTGRGEKLAAAAENTEEQLFFGKMLDAARQGCAAALKESFGERADASSLPKTVVLENAKVRSEKSRENISSPTFSEE